MRWVCSCIAVSVGLKWHILQEGLRLLDGREGRDLRTEATFVNAADEMRTEEVHAKRRHERRVV